MKRNFKIIIVAFILLLAFSSALYFLFTPTIQTSDSLIGSYFNCVDQAPEMNNISFKNKQITWQELSFPCQKDFMYSENNGNLMIFVDGYYKYHESNVPYIMIKKYSNVFFEDVASRDAWIKNLYVTDPELSTLTWSDEPLSDSCTAKSEEGCLPPIGSYMFNHYTDTTVVRSKAVSAVSDTYYFNDTKRHQVIALTNRSTGQCGSVSVSRTDICKKLDDYLKIIIKGIATSLQIDLD